MRWSWRALVSIIALFVGAGWFLSGTPALAQAPSQDLPPECVAAGNSPNEGVEGTKEHVLWEACGVAYMACIFSPKSLVAAEGDRQVAIQECVANAISKVPASSPVPNKIGVCRSDDNNTPTNVAIEACTEVIKSPTESLQNLTDAYTHRALWDMDEGQMDAAINDSNQAVRLDPHVAMSFFVRAIVRGKRLESGSVIISDLNQAISLNLEKTYLPRALELRGVELGTRAVFEKIGKQFDRAGKDNGSAIKDFNAALELDPKYAEAFYQRGQVEKEIGQTAQAEADIDAAKRLDPRFAE
jgi:tetratricopeptide (TPR) repeat protein